MTPESVTGPCDIVTPYRVVSRHVTRMVVNNVTECHVTSQCHRIEPLEAFGRRTKAGAYGNELKDGKPASVNSRASDERARA